MSAMQAAMDSEVDRLCELANIGAGHAATAFARLAGLTVWMDVPRVSPSDAPLAVAGSGRAGMTGIFFEIEGSLGALLAILFEQEQGEAVARRVLGATEGDPDPRAVEAALAEVGNILASTWSLPSPTPWAVGCCRRCRCW